MTHPIRTSATHPLQINWLPPQSRVGLTFAPGKKCHSTYGYRWERDVDADLDGLVAEGVTTLVCLMEDHELAPNGLAALFDGVRARNIELLRLPIRDVDVPSDARAVDALLDRLERRVADGGRIVIHCLGGLGRTGTIAGCYLVRSGVPADDALAILREVRDKRCPETEAQRAFVRSCARGSWYALTPHALTDCAYVEELTRALGARERGGARRLAEVLEKEVAAAPERCFTLDESGATLNAGGRTYRAGQFSMPTIGELRERAGGTAGLPRRPANGDARVRLSVLRGAHVLTDIGTLQATAPGGTLFQVASQFDCLEAPGPHVVPVREYTGDPTQGPRACLSALPGILLRHYRAPSANGHFVQTDRRCLNLLEDVAPPSVAEVQSGYLLASKIHAPAEYAASLVERFDHIRVGVHDDIEVVLGSDWDGPVPNVDQRVAQVLTSTIALGAYSSGGGAELATIRRQLLRGAYLGTLLAAVVLKKRNVVLTMIGGGVFGNPIVEIWAAIRWALAEADAYLDGEMNVIVNTREELDADARAEVRARGGVVVEFANTGVTIV